MSWRDEMTAAERKVVEKAEAAKRAKDAKAKADADAVIRPIRERCTKRMMRANRNGPCKQDENNDASD